MNVIDSLLVANNRYAAQFDGGLPVEPRKKVAVVACMDARLDTCHALGLEPGDAHLIRNAGGIITDDVLRSLLISQHLLGTNAVMLIHHTGCGLAGLDPHAVVVEVERRTGSQPPMDIGAFSDVELDVRAGIERIRSASYLPHREIVRGFVYDVLTGRLREVR